MSESIGRLVPLDSDNLMAQAPDLNLPESEDLKTIVHKQIRNPKSRGLKTVKSPAVAKRLQCRRIKMAYPTGPNRIPAIWPAIPARAGRMALAEQAEARCPIFINFALCPIAPE